MILDNYLTFEQKIYIAVISSVIWIYLRTSDCYALIPRKSIFSVLFVATWVYTNYYEPLVVPLGLLILYLYSEANKVRKNVDKNNVNYK